MSKYEITVRLLATVLAVCVLSFCEGYFGELFYEVFGTNFLFRIIYRLMPLTNLGIGYLVCRTAWLGTWFPSQK